MRPAHIVALAVVALTAAMLPAGAPAQTAPAAPPGLAQQFPRPVPLTDIAVPYDQSEPVSGGAQLVTAPEDRAQTLQLLRLHFVRLVLVRRPLDS